MDAALLLARIALAAVFIVAGIAKLADRRGSAQAMRDFGVPERFAAPLGNLLPLAELAVAIALIPVASAWWGALGALLLLLAFVAGIGVNLARGNQPDCHCFGQLHSEPVGWPTLARNAALAAIASFVLWQGWDDPGASTVAWIGDLSALQLTGFAIGVIALAALAVEGWALVQLLAQNGRLLTRLDALEASMATGDTALLNTAPGKTAAAPSSSGLAIGTAAPSFALPDLDDNTTSLDTLRTAGKPVMLVFSDPNCGPCSALMPDLARWQRDHAAVMTLAIVSRGTAESNRAKTAEHTLRNVVLQHDREVALAYQAPATPTAVLVRPDGTIGSLPSAGSEAIRGLVARTMNSTAPTPPSFNGSAGAIHVNGNHATRARELAPAFELPDLDGVKTKLDDFNENSTMLLFWNPGCGFCQRMLDDLKRLEGALPDDSPRILVVSTGDAERNRAMELRSTVLLDQGFATGRLYGATGTPSAVLIDADGYIASDVAIGAPRVLALAQGGVAASAKN